MTRHLPTFRKALLITGLFLSSIPVSSQTVDVGIWLIHTTASYENYRPDTVYRMGMSNPERYHNTGIYLQAFDGSLLGFLFSESKFMIGDYFRIGAGIGRVYSKAYDIIDDNGDVVIGKGGVYGTEDIVSFGPVDKTRFGYWVDLNYGFQAEYRMDDWKKFGIRWYYRVHLDPVTDLLDYNFGYSLSGVIAGFVMIDPFSVTVEWNPSLEKDYSMAEMWSVAARKRFSYKGNGYWGLRYEQIKGFPENGRKMRVFTTSLMFGLAF
ncbi:MAG: hypothetical protein LPK47_11705 [Bacteroidota bacterium]|nr:hypothetical protein [Bacteroidota bacterium]